MKKLLIAAILLVSIAGFAQEKKDGTKRAQKMNMEKLSPEQRTEKRIAKMTKELTLDAKQQEKIRGVFKEEAVSKEKQRAEMKKKKEQAREKMDSRMKAILTPEQLAKMESNKSEMKNKMQERRGKRKSAAGME
jgi:Spy/CpxP family protein refolding chaperone